MPEYRVSNTIRRLVRPVVATGFQQNHLVVRRLGQTRRHHTSCRTAANNQVRGVHRLLISYLLSACLSDRGRYWRTRQDRSRMPVTVCRSCPSQRTDGSLVLRAQLGRARANRPPPWPVIDHFAHYSARSATPRRLAISLQPSILAAKRHPSRLVWSEPVQRLEHRPFPPHTAFSPVRRGVFDVPSEYYSRSLRRERSSSRRAHHDEEIPSPL